MKEGEYDARRSSTSPDPLSKTEEYLRLSDGYVTLE